MLIEFPKGASLYAPQTLATIAAVHATVEKQAGVGNVWSLETLQRWLAEKAAGPDVATLKQYVDILPEDLMRRFIAPSRMPWWCPGRIPDVDASQLLPVINELDDALDAVRARHPGYTISVTGLAAIAARNSAAHDRQVEPRPDRSKSCSSPPSSASPSVPSWSCWRASCPASSRSSWPARVLWLIGEGLQFASVVALTVSFGLGLSATIHFLNRLRLEDDPDDPPASRSSGRPCWWARR